MCSCQERDRAVEQEVTKDCLIRITFKDYIPTSLAPSLQPPLQVPLPRISSHPACARSRWSPGPGLPSAGASALRCRGAGAHGRWTGWVANQSGLKNRIGDGHKCGAGSASCVCRVFPSWAAAYFTFFSQAPIKML